MAGVKPHLRFAMQAFDRKDGQHQRRFDLFELDGGRERVTINSHDLLLMKGTGGARHIVDLPLRRPFCRKGYFK
jgi:hypothetical protein